MQLGLVAILVLTALAGAQQDHPSNLLENGSGDSLDAKPFGKEFRKRRHHTLPGWTEVEGKWAAQPAGMSKTRPATGMRFVRCLDEKRGVLEQVVPASRLGAKKPKFVLLSVEVGNWQGDDEHEVVLELLDRKGKVVGRAGSGVSNEQKWARTFAVLPWQRSADAIRVRLIATNHQGTYNDAYFDGARLMAIGNGHPAPIGKEKAAALGKAFEAANRTERRGILGALCGLGRSGAKLLRACAEKQTGQDRFEADLLLVLAADKRAVKDLYDQLVSGRKGMRPRVANILVTADPQWPRAFAKQLATRHDANLRETLLRHLVTQENALDLLAQAYRGGDESMQLAVLQALDGRIHRGKRLASIYCAPHLSTSADEDLREEAMRLLAESRDTRFLDEVKRLYPEEGNPRRRNDWFRLAADFGTPDALEALIDLVEKGAPQSGSAFVDALESVEANHQELLRWSRSVGLGHKEAHVRQAALAYLRRATENSPDADDHAALVAAVRDPSPWVARTALRALAVRPPGQALEAVSALMDDPPDGLGAAVAQAFWQLSGADRAAADTLVTRASKSQDPGVTAGALAALQTRHAPSAAALARACLAHPDRRVRAAAATLLGRVRERSSIEALIERMPEEHGSATFFADALARLTGMDQGDDAAIWQRWWQQVGDSFSFRNSGKKRPPKAEPATTAAYYGLPLRGQNIAFAIDLSGSMRERMGSETRLERAKRELQTTLQQLRPDQSFQVLGFGTEVVTLDEAALPATASNVQRAAKWVQQRTVIGATNIFDALERATRDPLIESVYILTDGGPSAGTFVGRERIRTLMEELSRERYVRIYTVALGNSKSGRGFLRDLARENYGETTWVR